MSTRYGFFILCVLFLFVPAAAMAEPGSGHHAAGSHHAGGGGHHGGGGYGGHHGGYGKGHHRGSGKHGYGMPGNFAAKILRHGKRLNLTANQVKKIKSMRDEFIEKQSVNKGRLKAARMDLRNMLHDDSVSYKSLENHLSKIGKLEAQLWRAFAKQVKDIRAMLTPEQKSMLEFGRR